MGARAQTDDTPEARAHGGRLDEHGLGCVASDGRRQRGSDFPRLIGQLERGCEQKPSSRLQLPGSDSFSRAAQSGAVLSKPNACSLSMIAASKTPGGKRAQRSVHRLHCERGSY